MRALETLLENYWIIKEENKELYYEVKDGLPRIKSFIEDKLGYQIIVNPYLIKLEKLPGKPEGWMGIQTFDHPMEYALLCLLLTFLEDKGVREQFVLSEITEFLQGIYPGEIKLDWTLFQHRRSLIKVLRFAEEVRFMKINDGDDGQFIKQEDAEVLYECTGVSRYFLRHFTGNILSYKNWKDIEENEWVDIDRERGRVRRNRVYRRLVMAPVVYQEGIEDPDYLYIKNYRSMLQNDIEKQFEASFHLHKNGALVILDTKRSYKDTFPSQKGISDVVLFINRRIVEEIAAERLLPRDDDTLLFSKTAFEGFIKRVRAAYQEGWSKAYREMTDDKLCQEVISYMEDFQMIEVKDQTKEIQVMPLAGKMIGSYPNDFLKNISLKGDKTNEE